MKNSNIRKIVLAYSGGLDTSIIVPWLRENYNAEVVCFTADIGQGEELSGLEEKALASGASKLVIKDLRDEFARDFLFPMLQSGAIYEKQYLLGTAIARPLTAKWQVAVAEEEGADGLAHGCTGKGNDQVRFELTYRALNPTLQVVAPWRVWDIRSREDALHYADQHNVPVSASTRSIYSRDRNLWHLSHEGGSLEDPALEPEESMYQWVVSPLEAPDKAEEIEIRFESGVPIAVDGERLEPADLIKRLNELGARHGVGRADMVENRLVGMKSHGVYETPGGTILSAAHRELESICLDRDTLHFKEQVALRYAELIYFGKWFTSLRVSIGAFIRDTQKDVNGWVRLRLYKGNVIVVGRKSDRTLYNPEVASFDESGDYRQADAEGFIRLNSLRLRIRALAQK
ncbi:MAG: argininosuccinate synthase [Nitrospinae bacterium]|nr:argininosuccinate synthase [Nitrospinota bacterium]